MKLYIGADHAGYNLKEHLVQYLEGLGYKVIDMGASTLDKDDDYPNFCAKVARAVSHHSKNSKGIIIGGTGQGEAMMANRFRHVRAAVFYGGALAHEAVDIEGRSSIDPFEIVKLSRVHNDANILSFSARFVNEDKAKEALKLWLETKFEGEARHKRRIRMLDRFAPHRITWADVAIFVILIWYIFFRK